MPSTTPAAKMLSEHYFNFIEQKGHLHYLHFWWKFVKASVEAFIASMEAFMEALEASMKAWKLPWKLPSTEATSTEITSTSMKAFTEASTEAI